MAGAVHAVVNSRRMMTAIAEELDRRLQTLDPERAARCEQLIRDVLALLETPTPAPASPSTPYVTRTHDFGFKPEVDLTKLGQMVDEL